jgi:hypothetical protein
VVRLRAKGRRAGCRQLGRDRPSCVRVRGATAASRDRRNVYRIAMASRWTVDVRSRSTAAFDQRERRRRRRKLSQLTDRGVTHDSLLARHGACTQLLADAASHRTWRAIPVARLCRPDGHLAVAKAPSARPAPQRSRSH